MKLITLPNDFFAISFLFLVYCESPSSFNDLIITISNSILLYTFLIKIRLTSEQTKLKHPGALGVIRLGYTTPALPKPLLAGKQMLNPLPVLQSSSMPLK